MNPVLYMEPLLTPVLPCVSAAPRCRCSSFVIYQDEMTPYTLVPTITTPTINLVLQKTTGEQFDYESAQTGIAPDRGTGRLPIVSSNQISRGSDGSPEIHKAKLVYPPQGWLVINIILILIILIIILIPIAAISKH